MKRIVKIDVRSAAKAGGILAILVGVLVGFTFILWAFAWGGAAALPIGHGITIVSGLLFIPGLLGMYGLAGAALFAWLFNLTSRMTGGVAIELE